MPINDDNIDYVEVNTRLHEVVEYSKSFLIENIVDEEKWSDIWFFSGDSFFICTIFNKLLESGDKWGSYRGIKTFFVEDDLFSYRFILCSGTFGI